jgi:hypothetical protein
MFACTPLDVSLMMIMILIDVNALSEMCYGFAICTHLNSEYHSGLRKKLGDKRKKLKEFFFTQ